VSWTDTVMGLNALVLNHQCDLKGISPRLPRARGAKVRFDIMHPSSMRNDEERWMPLTEECHIQSQYGIQLSCGDKTLRCTKP
jgi:hypothetical protein